MKHSLKKYWHDHKQVIALAVAGLLLGAVVVQYAFGLSYALLLLPIVLAVITAIALLFWDIQANKKVLVALVALFFGFIIELLMVHSGQLFGNYSYGTLLGYRIGGVPIIIGLIWFLITLSVWHIVSFGRLTKLQLFLLGGVLVVMFDLILEQFATSYGLWVWQSGRATLGHYVIWFLVAELILYGYSKIDKKSLPSLYIAGLLPVMAIFCWLMLLVR